MFGRTCEKKAAMVSIRRSIHTTPDIFERQLHLQQSRWITTTPIDMQNGKKIVDELHASATAYI